jgi:hypothetical protein
MILDFWSNSDHKSKIIADYAQLWPVTRSYRAT